MSSTSSSNTDISWYPIPKGHNICPVCEGTGKTPIPESQKNYTWNKGKTHHECLNCGGQTMGGKAHGYTKIDPATGLGCLHSYKERSGGRCYHIYTCTKCSHSYDIDSGD